MNTSQSETIDDGLCLVRKANPEDPASMLFAALDCYAANRLARCAEKVTKLTLCMEYLGTIPPIPLADLHEAVDRYFYYSARGDFLEPRWIDETVSRASLELLELMLQRDGPLNALCYDILGLIEGVAPVTVSPPWRKLLQRCESGYRVEGISHRQFLEAAVCRLAVPAAPIVWESTGCHLRWTVHDTPLWAARERAAGQFKGYPVFEWHRAAGWGDDSCAWVFSPRRAPPTETPMVAERISHDLVLHRDRDDAIYIREDEWRIRSETRARWPGMIGQN